MGPTRMSTSHAGHRRGDAFHHRRQQWRNCQAKCLPVATVQLDTIPDVVSSCLAFETAEGVPVQVLGVDHLAMQYDLGDLRLCFEFSVLALHNTTPGAARPLSTVINIAVDHAGELILANQPHSVVLESAMSTEFGSCTGNTLTAADADSGRSDQTALRVIFAVSDFLRSVQNPSKSSEWAEVKQRMYGEQLAAVAALTVGARLVYGDLPKDVTFRRLLHGCSVTDLDRSFGHRSAQNFASLLGQHIPDLENDQAEKILMTDRECALCYSIEAAARGTAASGRGVVAIVGVPPMGLHVTWQCATTVPGLSHMACMHT